MDLKERMENLTRLALQFTKFGETPLPQNPEQENFSSTKIKDGETMVDYNPNLEVGTPVKVSSGTGSVDASDGTMVLDNGIEFVVKDGKIESVVNDGKQDPAKDDNAEGFSQEAFDALVLENKTLTEKFNALELVVNGFEQRFSLLPTTEQLETFSGHLKTVGGVIEEIAKIPVNVPEAIVVDAAEAQKQGFENVAAKFNTQDN